MIFKLLPFLVLSGCVLKSDGMDYFNNESEVMIIISNYGDLNIENRLDRVSIYGSLEITKDNKGLDNARRLQSVLNGVVSSLENAGIQ